jgi:4-hydroxybenzoate polyprenyltransferase
MPPASTGLGRWWTYQAERFPLLAHAPLVFAFSLSGVCLSALLRRNEEWPRLPLPSPAAIGVAFVGSLLFFLQLRIADEFKDADEDAKYRPYRPVPRGLVTLRELGGLFVLAAAIQLVLTIALRPTLVVWLVVVWTYLALMSKEFFVGDWLRVRPILYVLSHMLIMPCIDLYVTACDWLETSWRPPPGIEWFLAVSYANGLVIEIGRKIRAPKDEETGVTTYSAIWGPRRAVAVWFGCLILTATCAAMTAHLVDFLIPAAILLVLLLAVAGWLAARFLGRLETGRAKAIEVFSGIWTLLMYLSLGAAPMAWRLLMHGGGT